MQCPWPLNCNTEEEFRIQDDPNSTSSSSTSAKKRKKEKHKEIENCPGDSLSVNLDKLDNLEESKSPNSIKKLKLARSDSCEPVVMAKESKEPIEQKVNADENSSSRETELGHYSVFLHAEKFTSTASSQIFLLQIGETILISCT